MSDTFKPGDVVELRSGGPMMTVESVGSMASKDGINCVWFEKTKQMHGQFPPAVLILSEDVPSGPITFGIA